MCRLSASTQSCPSSSQVHNLALQQLRLSTRRAASVKLEGMSAAPAHLLVSRLYSAQTVKEGMHLAQHRWPACLS